MMGQKKAISQSAVKQFKKSPVEMTFEKENIDLGTIKKGNIEEFEFKFENTGSEAIEIQLVSACECSTVDWPSTPITPGESGSISVKFDSGKKEVEEVVDVDVILKNKDKATGRSIFKILSFTYQFGE